MPRRGSANADPDAERPRSLRRAIESLIVRHRTAFLIAIHVAVFAAIYVLAHLVRFDSQVPDPVAEIMLATMPIVIAVKLGVFLAVGSHRGWWRYATFADMIVLTEAATIAGLIFLLATASFRDILPLPRSVLLLDWAGTILVLGGLRGSTRLFRERYYPMISTRPQTRVLIVGASEGGIALVREIQSQPRLGMRVVGFVDPEPWATGRLLSGVPVLGVPGSIAALAESHTIHRVLIPTPATAPAVVREVATACQGTGVEVKVVPGVDALVSGALTIRPRDVDIHDLLTREAVQLDSDSINHLLHGRVILVTGAAGSIGSEICRQLLTFRPKRIILLDHSENGLFYIDRELQRHPELGLTEITPQVASITDAVKMRCVFETFRPHLVFHAAAHKHVPMMELHPGEAVKNNVFGTKTLADEAIRAGVEALVMVSTDKAVNPTSVMGACKRLAEMYVQDLACRSSTRLVTVRFGNVLGSNGSVVPVFQEQIRNGGPVTVTHPDMTRYFMTIPEAAQLVLQAGALGRGGEIFVLDMGQPVRVLDLARDLIRLSGMPQAGQVEIVFTGLRPGEKLHEELYDSAETHVPTPHPKIFAVQSRSCCPERLARGLDQLAQVVNGPRAEVVTSLKAVVPEYRPVENRPASPDRPAAPRPLEPAEVREHPQSFVPLSGSLG